MEPQLPCAHTSQGLEELLTSVVGDSCRAQLVSPEAEEPEEATNFFSSNLQVLYREEILVARLEVLKILLRLLISFVVCGAGGQTQGLMHTRQALSTKPRSRHISLRQAQLTKVRSGYYTVYTIRNQGKLEPILAFRDFNLGKMRQSQK